MVLKPARVKTIDAQPFKLMLHTCQVAKILGVAFEV